MRDYRIYDSIDDEHAEVLTSTCPFCHQQGWITIHQRGADALMEGYSVQEALPGLDPRQREQIISGIHPRCYPGNEFGDGIDLSLIRD